MLHVESSTLGWVELTALRGAAGARAGWNPQAQPPQGWAVAKSRADGKPEQSLQQQWCGVSGGRATMVVFPAAAELPGEREATHGPTQGEHGN